MKIRKENIKLPLFSDDVRPHIENPKQSIKKLFRTINEFSKLIGYKINIQKITIFL